MFVLYLKRACTTTKSGSRKAEGKTHCSALSITHKIVHYLNALTHLESVLVAVNIDSLVEVMRSVLDKLLQLGRSLVGALAN